MSDKGVTLTISPERVLSYVALATFAYYVLTFAFEIGFFWEIGLEYMAAFSLTEHIVHAAALVVYGVGLLLVTYFVFMYPATFFPRFNPDYPSEPGDKSLPYPRLDWWSGFAVAGIIALAAVAFIFDTFQEMRREGVNPSNLWISVALIALVLFIVRKHLKVKPMLWAVPAMLAVIIAPVAFGHSQFRQAYSSAPATQLQIGQRRLSVVPIFVGLDRGIYRTGQSLYLVQYDGELTAKLRTLIIKRP